VPDILYISGSGRSGSTLLERVLHSANGVSALGEFHCLWRLPADEIACSCGSAFGSDPFWQPVLAESGIDDAAIAELRALEGLVCRTGFIARHRFSLASLRDDADVQRFLSLQFRLFEAISSRTGSPLLVDSSKAGPRAWLMACDPRVRIVHLYRDPADVIVSWRSAKYDPGLGQEMKRLSIHAAALDWLKVEQLTRRLAREVPVCRVDYGALCAQPQKSLAGMLERLSLRTKPAPQWTSPDTVIPGEEYHSLNGNPDRFGREPIRISARSADWSRVPRIEGLLIRLIAAALRAAYPVSR
jgi:hypothetical protein